MYTVLDMEEQAKNLIKEKDLVMVYLDEKRQFLVQIVPGLRLSTDHGDLNLTDTVGKPFGYVGKTHLGRDFFCLKPSTADLMMKMKRMKLNNFRMTKLNKRLDKWKKLL